MNNTNLCISEYAKKRLHEIDKNCPETESRLLSQVKIMPVFVEKPMIVFYVKIDEKVDLLPGTVMSADIGGKKIPIVIDNETKIKTTLGAKELVIIAMTKKNECTAMNICENKYYNMFSNISNLQEKILTMHWFEECINDKQRENIIVQNNGCHYDVAEDKSHIYIRGMSGLKNKFLLCKSSFTPQQQADIYGLFGDGRLRDKKTERKLEYILNITTTAKNIELSKDEIIAALDKKLYKLNAVKEKIAETIVASKYSKNKGIAILLVGSPGVGKTAIAKAIADVLNIPYAVIPMGASTSKLDMSGDASQYDSSDCGEVIKIFFKYLTTHIVLCLDEFDKSDTAKDGNPAKAFNDMLSDEHYFKDNFLTTYIDTSSTVVIATANTTDTIPDNLLNRFTVINIDNYTEEDKLHIVKEYVLPEILSKYSVDSSLLKISDTVIKYIANNYCEDDGARDMKKHMESIVRNFISEWDEHKECDEFTITKKRVDNILGKYVNSDNPVIIYRRNKTLYSKVVSQEIEILIANRLNSSQPEEKEKNEKRLSYLVNLVPRGNAFSSFNANDFYNHLESSHYGQKKVKDMLAKIFYARAISGKSVSSIRILFVGSAGIGKTSIAKSIAEACGAEYEKISLNGVSDESVIKGHLKTYIGADAGSIIKAAHRKKTTKMLIQLDEIDKMGSKEGVNASNALIDLLDDSGEFTDHFLGVPTDFSSTMFIATANDLSKVHPLLRDRFTVINLEGYTKDEKKKIVSDYVLPRAIAEYCPANYHISMSEDANELLVDDYCRSIGIRDADSAIRTIVRDKVYAARTKKTYMTDVISMQDIKVSLGVPPHKNGNYPETNYPGLSRGLAVTGDGCGMTFAIETAVLPNTSEVIITGLANEVVSESVKVAMSYIKCNYPEALDNKGLHIHFAEGAIPKDGPSAGVAILISILSAVYDKAILEPVAYTGEINLHGNVWVIGGELAKIKAAEKSGCSKVFIPKENYERLSRDAIDSFSIKIVPVTHVNEVISEVLDIA